MNKLYLRLPGILVLSLGLWILTPAKAQEKPIPQPARISASQIGISVPHTILPPNILAWDTDIKENHPAPGDTNSAFSFTITNISSSPVIITAAKASCFCTVTKTKPLPWVLAPNETGEIEASVDLRGKVGTLHKAVTVETDRGFKVFMLTVVMPDPVEQARMSDRTRNTAIAAVDRQAVFRGDCAKCHAEPAAGKSGEPLFTVACGICHESEHRATAVPDLKALPHPTDLAYWRQWITHGKPGSMMPAFSTAEGGPLSSEQIESLAGFLTQKIPSRETAASSTVSTDKAAK